MMGKPVRGAAANPPKVSASQGTIKEYMIQEGGKESGGNKRGLKAKPRRAHKRMG